MLISKTLETINFNKFIKKDQHFHGKNDRVAVFDKAIYCLQQCYLILTYGIDKKCRQNDGYGDEHDSNTAPRAHRIVIPFSIW